MLTVSLTAPRLSPPDALRRLQRPTRRQPFPRMGPPDRLWRHPRDSLRAKLPSSLALRARLTGAIRTTSSLSSRSSRATRSSCIGPRLPRPRASSTARWSPSKGSGRRARSIRGSSPSAEASAASLQGSTHLTRPSDHTIVLPILRSINSAYGPVSVLHFDSHLDVSQTSFGSRFPDAESVFRPGSRRSSAGRGRTRPPSITVRPRRLVFLAGDG